MNNYPTECPICHQTGIESIEIEEYEWSEQAAPFLLQGDGTFY
jgi:hypothetical protein